MNSVSPEELTANTFAAVKAQWPGITEKSLRISPFEDNTLLLLIGSPYSLYSFTTQDRIDSAELSGAIPEQLGVIINDSTGEIEVFADFDAFQERFEAIVRGATITNTDNGIMSV